MQVRPRLMNSAPFVYSNARDTQGWICKAPAKSNGVCISIIVWDHFDENVVPQVDCVKMKPVSMISIHGYSYVEIFNSIAKTLILFSNVQI